MNFKILLSILSLVFVTNSLKSSDFCHLNGQKCVGRFGKNNVYKEECEYEKCSGPYSYNCSQNRCSRSRKQCDEYNEMNKIFNLNSFEALSKFSYIWQSSEQRRKKFAERFNSIMSKVNVCRPESFNPNNICLLKRHCFKLNSEKFIFSFN